MKSKLLASLALVCNTAALAGEKPNIIFILADDLGYGDVSCFNDTKLIMTPNLDKIAQQGVMMTQTYVYPVSAPTRAAFLTGSQGHEIGVYGNADSDVPGVGPERKTFTPKLQELGYATAWFGKWHQGYSLASHPMNNGFDRAYGFLGGMHDFHDPKDGSFYNGGPYSKYSNIYDDFEAVDQMEYFTKEITNQALDFIEQQSDNPFYIYLAYNAPHTPLQAPDSVILKYLKQGHEAIAATRYAMIDYMDQEIGRIMAYLQEKGLDENTMLVFMSDNGPELEINSGGYKGHKFTIWEGGIRAPLIVKYPGVVPAGKKSNSMCGVYDLATTFLTLAAGEPMSFGSGVDLMPYFTLEKTDNARDEFIIANEPRSTSIPYTHNNMNLLMVRSHEWKLVKDVQRSELGLYNMDNDPQEKINLYSEHPDVVERLLDIANQKLKVTPISSSRSFTNDLSKQREQSHKERYNSYQSK